MAFQKQTIHQGNVRMLGLDVSTEIRQRIIYMQREGWGRHWGKETEREGASDGEMRDTVAREQYPHRGPLKTGQRQLLVFAESFP